MGLAQLFYLKETVRENLRRWRQTGLLQHAPRDNRPLSHRASAFQLEALEARLLLSADLAPQTVDAPATAQFGAAVELSWVDHNGGADPVTSAWNDKIWLSSDQTLGPDDLLLATRTSNTSSLAPGADYVGTATVSLPLNSASTAGTYFLLVQSDADNAVTESDETNNVAASQSITVSLPPNLVQWDGGGDGTSWNDALNWVADVLPGQNANVIIDATGNNSPIVITSAAGLVHVNSVFMSREMILSSGATLQATVIQASRNITMTGGTILGGTVALTEGATLQVGDLGVTGTLVGVTLSGDVVVSGTVAALRVGDGLTLNGTIHVTGVGAHVRAVNTQTFSGAGTIVFENLAGGPEELTIEGDSTLTLASGFTVTGGGGTIGGQWERGGANALINEGTIAATVAGQLLTVTGSTVTNRGVLSSPGGNLSIEAPLNVEGLGILAGQAGGTTFVTRDLLGDTRNSDLFGSQAEIQFRGTGPQLLEVMSRDLGSGAAAFSRNFAYRTVALSNGTSLKLVNMSDNAIGSGPEAVYTNSLVVAAGATLDLNGLQLYVRGAQIEGSVFGGTVIQIPDSGPITPASLTPGGISVAGELDEWSFFARAGQSIAVAVDTGGSAVLTPKLNWAHVELVDSAGSVMAIKDSTAEGQVVTLNNVAIPTDGVYRVRVNAPVGHLSVTGNYLVSVWNVTADVASLLLNQQVTGQIENPFSIDQWRFSATAGTQVRFDLVNRSSSAILFDLTGPNGWTGFADNQDDSDLITLPGAGTYTLTAHGTSGLPGGSYAFALQQTRVTELPLGSFRTGQFVGSGQAELYRIEVPTSNSLKVILDDDASNNVNELYLKFGAPPTRGDYDYKFDAAASADQEIVVSSSYPGQWYALIYGNTIRTNSSFDISAQTNGVFLSHVTPDHYATGATATLNLTGSGFDVTTSVVLVAPNLTVVPVTSITIHSPTQATANISLNGLAPGMYTVRAAEPGNVSDTLVNAFTVTDAGGPRLETRLVLPSQLGRHATATLYVDYANTGNEAMSAPLLVLQSADPDGSDRPLMTLDQLRVSDGVWASSMLPVGFGTSVQFLAGGATPGLLQPGESGRMPVYFVGLQRPWDFSDVSVEFSVGVLNTANAIAVDWNALEAQMKPDYVRTDAWDAIWDNFTAQVGTTWGSYLTALNENAIYLSTIGVSTAEISRLLAFELRQADALSPIRYLAASTDAAMPAPGPDLVFSEAFAQPISRRYELGTLGRGWAHNWQLSLATEADGTVKITDMTGTPRIFQPDSRFLGRYLGATGDNGKLVSLSGGTYRLTETDGTAYTFRSDGKLDFVQDTNGNRITISYTSGLLTALTHSSGQSLTIAYNGAGRIASMTDSDGRQTIYTYDPANEHLLSVQDYDGRITSYSYITGQGAAREHALSEIVFADGSHRFYTYDNQGRLVSTSRDGGAELVTFTYNNTGTVTATDALGNASQFYFDDGGTILRSTNPLGNSVLLSLDSERNLRSVTDPAGFSSLFQYDTRGNLTRFTDAMGHTTGFTYTTDFNRLDRLTDANGNLTDYNYDSRGNLVNITYADGSQERWSYDSLGQSTTWTNRRGTPIGFTYNADGQITRKTYADGRQVEYSYDQRGNLRTAVDGTGTTTFTYDANDYLTRIDYPGSGGRWLAFTYDAGGRRATSTDQLGHVLTYHYDAAGRLSHMTNEANLEIVRYQYDDVGRIARKTLGNGVYTTYEYDAASQLLHLVNHESDCIVLSRFDYTYDSRGRRITMGTLDGAWTYTYDDIGQLTRAVFVSTNATIPNQDLRYVYDAMGNRVRTIENGVTTEYTTNNLNQYTQVGDRTYVFDADGNLISETSPSGTTRYSYDDENRLIAVQQGADAWSYTYDAFSQRVASTHNGTTIHYLIDPIGLGNVVGEYDASGNLIAGYDHGAGLLSRTVGGASSWYIFDALGNTSGLIDAAGNISNRYFYSPFGEILQETSSGSNPFQFVGEWGVMREGTGLDFMRARYYVETEGRFTEADPIGIAGGVNLYAYAGNDPIGHVDPLGTVGMDPWMLAPVYEQASDSFWNSVEAGGKTVLKRTREVVIWVHSRAPWIDDAVKVAVKFTAKAAGLSKAIPSVKYATPGLGEAFIYADLTMFLWEGANYTGKAAGEFLYNNYPPEKLPKFFQEFLDFALTESVGSGDPNQKLGPAGFGTQSYITAESAFPYRIDFENESNATAPAQIVTITDQLDTDLDWSTFALTELGFGDHLITVPTGSQYFETTVPVFYNGQEFEVQIVAGIDHATGLVFAHFYSINPFTGLPPDVLTGFLPPEDGTGRGMGYVSYVIDPKRNLVTGTEIRNIAYIVFDGQPAIATNQVDPHDPSKGIDPAKEALNTIDTGGPTSAVLSIPAQVTQSEFLLSWAGADDIGGSGIAIYDIYVSDNGGAFTAFLTGTTQTSALFTGQNGHSYQFYSIATDNVRHREAVPVVPDAATTVELGSAQIQGFVFEDVNVDGVRNGSEPLLAGRTLFLDANNNGALDAGEFSTLSDVGGAYSFVNLGLGTYHLAEVLSADWFTTTPLADRTVVISGGETFTGKAIGSLRATLDVDGNGIADALSDGIAIIRYLFGFMGDALINGAVDPQAVRATAPAVERYLAGAAPLMLDVDGNGAADALSDGIVIIRYLFGFSGDALINGVVDPAGTRNTAAAVETFLAGFLPGSTTAADLAAEPTGSAASPTFSPATAAVVVTDREEPAPDLSLAYVQRSWVKGFVAEGAGLADASEEDEELLIALPA